MLKAKERNRRLSDVTAEFLSGVNFTHSQRNLTTNLVQGCVRMSGRLDWELSKVFHEDYNVLRNNIKVILQLGAYQLKYLDSIPDYAAVTTSVSLAKSLNPKLGDLVNAVLRKISKGEFKFPDTDDIKSIAQYLSHPEWLIEKWTNEWGSEKVKKLAQWNNSVPKIWFRVNTLQFSPNKFKKFLDNESIGYEQFEDDPIYFTTEKTAKIIGCKYFKLGNITVQDPAAGMICHLLEPSSGDIIIDGCAAPGGKTTYLSQLMNNKGKIWAFDNHQQRLKLLKNTMTRMNITNISPQEIDTSTASLPAVSKILLDVPCSGTGVLGKRADLRWRKTFDDIVEMSVIQRNILWNAAKYLKSGGRLVYSTCSIEPEENKYIIDSFLEHHSDFYLEPVNNILPEKYVNEEGIYSTFPPEHRIDGGSAAILMKK